MKLPIQFPSDADVIAEESARFRALAPADRIRSIHGMLAAGALLISRAPNAAFLREQSLIQEELARKAIEEFLSRHGYKD
jgi:hypothetical protein